MADVAEAGSICYCHVPPSTSTILFSHFQTHRMCMVCIFQTSSPRSTQPLQLIEYIPKEMSERLQIWVVIVLTFVLIAVLTISFAPIHFESLSTCEHMLVLIKNHKRCYSDFWGTN